MATFKTSKMGLNLPITGLEPGPTYADDINTALTTVDAHDHIVTGNPITTAAIQIDNDLDLVNFNIKRLRSLRMTSQSGTLVASGDVSNLYVVSGDLYYNNASGTAIKVTSGTTLNTAALVNNSYAVKAISGNLTINSSDTYVTVEATTSGAITITLPTAASVTAGRFYIIKDVSGSAATNNITINRSSSDTLDGASSVVINTAYSAVMIVSDGTSSWSVLLLTKGVAGDLSGTLPSPKVVKLQGVAVSATAPTDGYVLTYVAANSNWQPYAATNVISINGDVTGTTASTTVGKIQNVAVLAGTPSDGQLLQYVSSNSRYEATSLGGDVTGKPSASTVTKLQGQPVAVATPASAQALLFNGSSWTPTSITGDASISSAGIVTNNKINLTTVTTNGGALTTGQVLRVTGAATSDWGALDLANSNATTGSLAYAKLALGGNITNSDISNTAAIFYNKLNLNASVANADIASNAAIAGTKISPNFGSQNVSTTGIGSINALNVAVHILATGLGTYNVDSSQNDCIVFVNTNFASQTVVLPAPTSGRIIVVKDNFGIGATNPVTIKQHSSEKIDGATQVSLNTNYGGYTFMSDGTNWMITAKV